ATRAAAAPALPRARLRGLGGVHADASRRAARVGGEREPQHVDRLVAAPQQRAVAGAQPAQPVAARVAEAAGPVVVERVVAAHLTVGVDLETGLLDAAAGAAVDPGEPLAAGYLPALVVGVVVGPQVHVHRDRDVPHAADAVLVLPDDRGRRVEIYARPDREIADPGANLPDRAEQPDSRRELVPAVVEHHDAATALHLLHLPFEAAPRHVPAAVSGSDHLHVVADGLADLAGLGHGLELAEWLVEEVVVHHPQDPVAGLRRIQHPLRVQQVVAHRLLQVDVPAEAKHLHDAISVQRDRQQDLDRVDLQAARRQFR